MSGTFARVTHLLKSVPLSLRLIILGILLGAFAPIPLFTAGYFQDQYGAFPNNNLLGLGLMYTFLSGLGIVVAVVGVIHGAAALIRHIRRRGGQVSINYANVAVSFGVLVLSLLLLIIAYALMYQYQHQPRRVIEDSARTSSDRIAWEEAVQIIHSGQVETGFQTHSRAVSLILRDGRSFHTTEPTIDAIFDEIRKCGAVCSNIQMATE